MATNPCHPTWSRTTCPGERTALPGFGLGAGRTALTSSRPVDDRISRREAARCQVLDLRCCGIRHDRDLFAARNIRREGRKVAAGAAETEMLRGGS
jgi:hypothetical protein